MRRLIIFIFVLVATIVLCTSCGSSKRYNSSLEGLMLQENTKLRINRAYYSHHNMKTRKDAYRRHKKITRR